MSSLGSGSAAGVVGGVGHDAGMPTTSATFEIQLTPEPDGDLGGAVGRFGFTKTWSGGVEGSSRGVMLTGGDPAAGAAGYVAMEVVEGAVDGRRGTFQLQQLGVAADGGQRLDYLLVPGSGTGDLAGITGSVELTVEEGRHCVELTYELP